VAQLVTLSYIDVVLKTDNDSQDLVLKGLVDTWAQVPMVKASLLPSPKPEVVRKIKLRPFCGQSVSADWTKIMMALPGNDFIKVECAVIDYLNEDLILTADVVSRLEKSKQKISVKEATSPLLLVTTSDDVNDSSVNDSNTEVAEHDVVGTDNEVYDINTGDVSVNVNICDHVNVTNIVDVVSRFGKSKQKICEATSPPLPMAIISDDSDCASDVAKLSSDVICDYDGIDNVDSVVASGDKNVDVSLTSPNVDARGADNLDFSSGVAKEQIGNETLKGHFILAKTGKDAQRKRVHVESVTYDSNAYCFDDASISLLIDEEHGVAIDSRAVIYENNGDFGHIVPAPLHSSDVIEWEIPSTKNHPESLAYLALEHGTSSEGLGFLDAMVHGNSLKKYPKLRVG